MEPQHEEVSSTFGWCFPGQVLLKRVRGSGLLAAGHELCRSPWPRGAWCGGHGHKPVRLQGKVGAVGEADAAAAAFRWDAGRPCECTVLDPGVSLQSSLSAGCQAGPRSRPQC